MNISDQAVEAAISAFPWQAADYLDADTVRAALEAAAPHMLADAKAEAWDEGHNAGRDYQGDGWNADSHNPDDDNPYRCQA